MLPHPRETATFHHPLEVTDRNSFNEGWGGWEGGRNMLDKSDELQETKAAS